MDLRQQLQDKMDKAGITRARLARLSDISYDTLNNFLKGESSMGTAIYETVNKILDSFLANNTSSSDKGNIT